MEDNDIKKLRSLLDWTQDELASQLGTTARTIQNWESGTKIPKSKMSALVKLAQKFPNEKFTLFAVSDSEGVGDGNKVGIATKDLKRILDEMESQRKDFMSELSKRDSQIEELISILKTKM